jgi:hypothetical protein
MAALGILISVEAGNNQINMLPKYTLHLDLYFCFFSIYRLMAKPIPWSLGHLTADG